MMHKIIRKLWTLVFCTGTALGLSGCGEEPAETQTTTMNTADPAPDSTLASASAGCEILPADLLNEVGMAYQLVRNLALAGGKNLAMMEKNMNTPRPETFRTFATAFEQMDVSTVEALPNFDKPGVAAAGIRELADKLEAALAQKDNLSDPAWAELAEFSKRRQNRQQASINYYLSELGCK